MTTQREKMVADLEHLAQTIHQAHHGNGNNTPWQRCRQHACTEIRKLIDLAAAPPPEKKRPRFPRFFVWLVGKPGITTEKIPQEIERSSIQGLTWGHEFGTPSTGWAYAKECVKDGWTVQIYEVW